jgi:hypothetical protein
MRDDPIPDFFAASATWRLSMKEAPLGIVGAVCTDKTNQVRALKSQVDKLVLRRPI